jgi:ribosome-binding factor A
MNTRKQRVEHAMRDVLTSMIRDKVKDPRVQAASLLTITRVEMNVDLSVANVYVSIVDDGSIKASRVIEKVIEGLSRSASFLRGPTARQLNLARPPELRFLHDKSAEMHERIAAVLAEDKAKADAANPTSAPSAETVVTDDESKK